MQTLALAVRKFHIVAVQEIRTQNDYLLDGFLRDYVNAGGGRDHDYVIGPRLGRSSSKEQYAFIYDAAAVEVNRQSIYTVNDPQDLLHREPLVVQFRVRGPPPHEAFTFVLVNMHTDPDEAKEEVDTLADVYHAVRQASGGEDDIVILGDLNVDDRNLGRLEKFPASGRSFGKCSPTRGRPRCTTMSWSISRRPRSSPAAGVFSISGSSPIRRSRSRSARGFRPSADLGGILGLRSRRPRPRRHPPGNHCHRPAAIDASALSKLKIRVPLLGLSTSALDLRRSQPEN